MCYIGGNYWVFAILAILAIVLIFRFICALVDEYIAAAIVYIQNWLGMSEVLAGVTLLALGNGAGDVVTAIVASGSADGVSYNIGALFGAGLFVATVVIFFTIKGSPEEIIVHKATLQRDLVYYIIATLIVIACGIYG